MTQPVQAWRHERDRLDDGHRTALVDERRVPERHVDRVESVAALPIEPAMAVKIT